MSLIKEVQTSNTRKYIATIAKLAIACVSMASVSFATTLTGFGTAFLQAGNGSVVVSGNGATGGCIIWYNAGNPPNTCPTTGNGNLTVQGGSSAPFFVGDPGTITNLNFNAIFPLIDFIVIDNTPRTPASIHFDLTDIRFNGSTAIGGCTGAAATSPGISCTPANSPFQLTNGLANPTSHLVDTVTVSLTVDAYGYTGSSGVNYNAATLYIGTISTQQAIQGANIKSILDTIAAGGSVNAAWAGTFTPFATTPTPEPAAFALLGTGLLGLGLVNRKRRKA